eukprot:CAMPEP_0180626694 /NCGR_PEP_ID=MMETSP1037_2-20121125/37977_1 /TAXON_ID=632150 /ORGANISM="Azadinium spinosum, Strain 3D9" /LENGTH=149 /DNA_ID=CAMNT_0022647271 /DNA_START=888 /DNA_END=1337 /DNA_ORIENTATION=-
MSLNSKQRQKKHTLNHLCTATPPITTRKKISSDVSSVLLSRTTRKDPAINAKMSAMLYTLKKYAAFSICTSMISSIASFTSSVAIMHKTPYAFALTCTSSASLNKGIVVERNARQAKNINSKSMSNKKRGNTHFQAWAVMARAAIVARG